MICRHALRFWTLWLGMNLACGRLSEVDETQGDKGAIQTREVDAASDLPPPPAPEGPAAVPLAHPLDGIYVGPSEAYVRVQGGIVREMRLLYSGNVGFMFVGARFMQDGTFPVANNNFIVSNNTLAVRGTFVRAGHIDGVWQEARFRGTWSADRVSGPLGHPIPPDGVGPWTFDAGPPPPLPVPATPTPTPVDPPRDAARPVDVIPPRPTRDAAVDRRG
jgi:hypothetical protein